jgi:hypothetical protein
MLKGKTSMFEFPCGLSGYVYLIFLKVELGGKKRTRKPHQHNESRLKHQKSKKQTNQTSVIEHVQCKEHL